MNGNLFGTRMSEETENNLAILARRYGIDKDGTYDYSEVIDKVMQAAID